MMQTKVIYQQFPANHQLFLDVDKIYIFVELRFLLYARMQMKSNLSVIHQYLCQFAPLKIRIASSTDG